jgi:hypothetical protein
MSAALKTLITTLVTGVLLIASVLVVLLFAGMGHGAGNAWPFVWLFPLAFLSAVVAPDAGFLSWVFGVGQFAAYGVIIGRHWIALAPGRALLWVGVAHVVVALLGSSIYYRMD